jgi:hypothetical protein
MAHRIAKPNSNCKIVLEPHTEIPTREKWLFKNKVAMKKINKGLKDAAAGRTSKRSVVRKFRTTGL